MKGFPLIASFEHLSLCLHGVLLGHGRFREADSESTTLDATDPDAEVQRIADGLVCVRLLRRFSLVVFLVRAWGFHYRTALPDAAVHDVEYLLAVDHLCLDTGLDICESAYGGYHGRAFNSIEIDGICGDSPVA